MSKGSHEKTFCKTYVAVIARFQMQYYGKYSPSFSYCANEKRGEYLRILHKATCNNCFVVKCFFNSNVAEAFLFTFTYLLTHLFADLLAKAASSNLKGALSSLTQSLATESPLKLMKNAFYFTSKSSFSSQHI